MVSEIPLLRNEPHQSFSADLGDYTLLFEFFYVTRFGYFRVNITDITSTAIVLTLGRIANPAVDLLAGVDIDVGRIFFNGDQPALDNLGISAKLLWEAPSG